MRSVMMVNASAAEVTQAMDERVPVNHLVNGSFTSSVKWIDKTFRFLEFSAAELVAQLSGFQRFFGLSRESVTLESPTFGKKNFSVRTPDFFEILHIV